MIDPKQILPAKFVGRVNRSSVRQQADRKALSE